MKVNQIPIQAINSEHDKSEKRKHKDMLETKTSIIRKESRTKAISEQSNWLQLNTNMVRNARNDITTLHKERQITGQLTYRTVCQWNGYLTVY